MNREPFELDEWYHCYNRGVEKRTVFEDDADASRFLQLLYLANDTKPLMRHTMSGITIDEAVQMPRAETLTAVGAYCLMSNHFHLLLRETTPGGISMFMRKLGTGYTMYFNAKHERTGNLFMKPFRSRHVFDDRYFQWVIRYIHCNPAEIHEPGWKEGRVRDYEGLAQKLEGHPYSSLGEYCGAERPQAAILDEQVFDAYRNVPLGEMLRDAGEYYRTFQL